MLGKLIEKVTGEHIQFHLILNNFIYLCYLRDLKHRSTTDAGITLTYFIHSGWIKNNMTSILVFNIAQFFQSLNHRLLSLILRKARCDSKVVQFFSNYLISKKTQYCWNNIFSQFFNIDVGVEQGSALSPILSALYIFLVLFVVQSKSLMILNSFLFCSYNIVSSLLEMFGLVLEYGKTEVFHFSRSCGVFNPPPLDLLDISGLSLIPKDIWRYLGFIFNRKLSFWQHINFYANKAISTVKYMKILRNSTWGLILH